MQYIIINLVMGVAITSTLIGVLIMAISLTRTLAEEIRELRKIHRKEES